MNEDQMSDHPAALPQQDKYAADRKEMFLAADGSMMCEAHPGREWPHDNCIGPGMPWVVTGRTLIEEMLSSSALMPDREMTVRVIKNGEAKDVTFQQTLPDPPCPVCGSVPQEKQRHCWCDRYKAIGGGVCEPCAARKAQEEIIELEEQAYRLGKEAAEQRIRAVRAEDRAVALEQERDAARNAQAERSAANLALLRKVDHLEIAIAQLREDRERARSERDTFHLQFVAMQNKAEAAEAAGIAMREYAQHKPGCIVNYSISGGLVAKLDVPKCTCGLSTVLTQSSQQD